MEVPKTELGSLGFQVSAQGLGCMSMSAFYGPPKPEDEMIALIRHAVSRGITFLDTADVYGPFTNEILVGKAIKGIREHVQIATKFAAKFADRRMEVRGDPAYVRAACEASLKRLDVDCIDLYYQHRVDRTVPIEITVLLQLFDEFCNLFTFSCQGFMWFYEFQMGELKKLVEEAKIKYIGLSEASAETIRRAHAVHPITAVQIEWSLWCRDVEEEIVPTCRELGIGIVSYSPLGRGFLSSGPKLMETLADNDYRKYFPRFQADNIEKNKIAYERICEMASKKGCTPSQLALAWVQHQGNDVVPIPGTTKLNNLEDNIGAFSVKLTRQEIQEIENAVSSAGIAGERYPEELMIAIWKNANTPPLSSWKTALT